MGFSKTARKGLVLATRILPFQGFVTTSGAALPVDAQTLREIQATVVPRYEVAQEGRCPLANGRRRAANLTAAIIRLCLESGASDRIQYGPPVAEPWGFAPASGGAHRSKCLLRVQRPKAALGSLWFHAFDQGRRTSLPR